MMRARVRRTLVATVAFVVRLFPWLVASLTAAAACAAVSTPIDTMYRFDSANAF